MNQLVIMKNKKAVTSTTNVAENFKREHYDVIKSVEKIKEDVGTFSEMFFEATEPDSYNRDRKIYLMNRDGFTLLAMGFTGKRAMEFKLKYIEAFNQMEKQITQPQSIEDLIIMQAQSVKELKEAVNVQGKKIESVEKKQDSIKEVFSLTTRNWRDDAKRIVNKIAQDNGGAYQQTWQKTYNDLEMRGRCNLERRLENMKNRAAEAGAQKREINSMSKLSVIERDPALTEIYLTIIKEMAIKHGIDAP